MKHYILNGKEPQEATASTWGLWFTTADRHVAKTELPHGFTVSTVFLGIDHGWNSDKPILFETMVFGDYDEVNLAEAGIHTQRYASWAEAEDGHIETVDRLQAWIAERVQ